MEIFGGPNGIRTPVTDVRVGENALFRHFKAFLTPLRQVCEG